MNDDSQISPQTVTLVIDKPAHESFIDFRENTISGRVAIGSVKVFITLHGYGFSKMEFEVQAYSFGWNYTLPHWMPQGKVNISVKAGIFATSGTFTVTQPPPVISPQEGASLLAKGTGVPGNRIMVTGSYPPGDNNGPFGFALVGNDEKWTVKWHAEPDTDHDQVYVATSSYVIAGNSFMSEISNSEKYSASLPTPSITGPDSNIPQAQTFPLSGIDGVVEATLSVYRDTTSDKVGEVQVSTGNWSVPVSLKPGNISLVAMQTWKGIPSSLSAPRAFRVRPPVLTEPDIHFTTAGTATFSGKGHFDEKLVTQIQFTIKDGPGAAPPNATVTKDGEWETTAVGWPFGTNIVQIIQKVGDGASGWIESLPFPFTVENKLPNVSELAHTLEYQPTFSGLGNARATVWLWKIDMDEEVAPHRLLTTTGKWTSQATQVWGPTFNRRVRIKQAGDGQETDWVY
ncbi:hypothetical protein J1G32_29275, partial [Pseudomonas fluorescens]|nr:hypothetical protein [Pseudomonas fluorescens]